MKSMKGAGTTKVFWRGELLPWDRARISPMNTGLFFGESLFESIPVYGHSPLFLPDHLDRLKKGCDFLDWPLPPAGLFRRAIGLFAKEWSKAPGFLARFQLVQETGPKDGPRTFSRRPPVLFATSRPLRHDPRSPLPPVGKVGVSHWRAAHSGMNPNGFKLPAYLTIRDTFRKNPGWDEMLRVNDGGYVVDGGGATPLWFDGERVLSPPLSLGGLESVTRKKMIRLARSLGLAVAEKAWKPSWTLQKGELFFVGSGVGLMRVSRLGGKRPANRGALGLRLWQYYRNWALGKLSAGL
jgi:branched-subunit amino acid aminotransferase/4-amino-4-deoxychorismate lyase